MVSFVRSRVPCSYRFIATVNAEAGSVGKKVKVKVKKGIAVRELNLTATGNHTPYGITQCYLPSSRGDFPAFTPAEAGTRFSDPEWMQG